MEKQIKRYIKAIRKRMACSSILKSQFIQDFENDILRYQSENSASYHQIVEHFGSPEQVASDFMEALDPSDIKRDSLHSKKIYWIVICMLIIVLLVLGYTFYYFYTHLGDESKSEITTIIYTDEPPPDEFWDSFES